jgi:hypothetical protein
MQWRAPQDGVYVLPPDVVRDVGNDSLKKGERVLDLFVKKVCNAEKVRKLPPPR